jgi:predicted dehydrogenase
MESINRRGFLKKSAVTTAGLVIGAPVIKKGFAKDSPNERINIAVIGVHGRGGGGPNGGIGHIKEFSRVPNVRVATLCDVDERLFPEKVAQAEEASGFKPKTEIDFRKVLEDKDIDAVSITTPEQWHALQTIWACQAGKDVYVEKPVSHTIDEGRKMVQAARKYNRVVQAGTQRRSDRSTIEAVKFLHEGKLGKIYLSRGVVSGIRQSIGHTKDSPIPNGVHWDLFLGPAPYRPFNENRFIYNWHWFWETGTAELGNNGIHSMDVQRWGMNKRVHPVKIHCTGGCYVWDSDQETPNVVFATYEYEDGSILECEVCNLPAGKVSIPKFYGSEGWMDEGNNVFFGRKGEAGPSISGGGAEQKKQQMKPEAKSADPHFVNFIDCVRSRRWQDLNAEIEEGHMSTALCHLGNISYRTGRKLTFNPYSEKFVNDEDANSYLKKEYRYPYAVPDEV